MSAEGLLTRGGKGTYPLLSDVVVTITAVVIGWTGGYDGDQDGILTYVTFYFESCDRSKQDGSMLTCEQLRTTSISKLFATFEMAHAILIS